MSVYSIKDLEHLSGIKAHTIRIWEQRHNLFTPKRTDTNIRFYNEEDLKLILNISLLKNYGIKISKIVQMNPEEIADKVMELGTSNYSNEDQINSLTVAMIDLDEEYFLMVMKKNVDRIGFNKTMTQIIYPFFRKIGILWMANSINPAHEHFITHLVRQQLIIETEKLQATTAKGVFMLFLPENELHELGLLYANFLLREHGFKTFYLGQSLPTKDLEEVYHAISPEFLFTVMTSKPTIDRVQKYINDLGKKFTKSRLFLTGNQVVGKDLKVPSNARIITDFEDLGTLLSEMSHSMAV